MEYAVNLTARAERDLANLYEQINAERSEAARKWYLGLKKEILSLGTLSLRCPVTPENANLRHLLYGHGHNTYRVIYRVTGSQVDVLHIRHGARKNSSVCESPCYDRSKFLTINTTFAGRSPSRRMK
jgi:plasmid stabilization system protein ParE